MKFLIVFFAISATAFAAVAPNKSPKDVDDLSCLTVPPTENLAQDLHDIFSLVPWDKVKELVERYAAEDHQIQQVIHYLQSDGFHIALAEISEYPEVPYFVAYLESEGINVREIGLAIHNYIESLPRLPSRCTRKSPGGVLGYLHELQNLIPPEMGEVALEKFLCSEHIHLLIETIKSEGSRVVVERILDRCDVVRNLDQLESWGVPVWEAIEDMKNALGWNDKLELDRQ